MVKRVTSPIKRGLGVKQITFIIGRALIFGLCILFSIFLLASSYHAAHIPAPPAAVDKDRSSS
jgi:hypothetical protein